MSKIKTILYCMKRENRSRFFFFIYRKYMTCSISKCFSDKLHLSIAYYLYYHKKMDWIEPKSFNEKLQWLKINDRNKRYVQLVDKVNVKEYVRGLLGNEVVLPTLGLWRNFRSIELDNLPNEFVLKCSHDSGGIVICHDKSKFNEKNAKSILCKSLKTDFYLFNREWPYKNVKPMIMAETLLVGENGTQPRDYKFFCFDGNVKFFKVDIDRFTNHRANYYDTDRNLLPFGEKDYPPDPSALVSLPNNLDIMIKYAEILSANIPFVRVDLYSENGKIYFGEMTFYPNGGFGEFVPDYWDRKIGDMLKIR